MRKKRYLDREYSYHTLKYREGKRIVNQHVPAGDVQTLSKRLEERRRYEKEIRALRSRIEYLEKLLGVGRG